MDSGNRKILVYRPLQLWLAAAVAAALLVVAAFFLVGYGQQSATTELAELRRQRTELERQLAGVREANDELEARIAVLQRSSEIDRRAALEVRNGYAALQQQLQEARRDLDFYRSIVSPGDVDAGLRVQRFHVEPGAEAGVYRYSVTLTQVKRNDRYVRGVMEIEIEGLEDGKSVVRPFSRLVVGKAKPLKFRFRYYQNFEGRIRIPADFRPQRVRIHLRPAGKGQPAAVEETLAWPA